MNPDAIMTRGLFIHVLYKLGLAEAYDVPANVLTKVRIQEIEAKMMKMARRR